MKLIKLFFSIYILPLSFSLFFQQTFSQPFENSIRVGIDSLITLINTEKNDLNKINHLVNLCWQYQDLGEYEEGLKYGFRALHISKAIQYTEGVADALNRIAEIYRLRGNYSNAMKNHLAALKISDQANYLNGTARAYKNIGVIYFNQGEYKKSLENYFTSVKIYKKLNSILGIGHCYNNIGMVYAIKKNYPGALKYFFSSLKIKETLLDKKGIIAAKINIGIIFNEQGNSASVGKKEYYKNAYENFLSALKISEEIDYKKGIADAYNNTGELFMDEKNYTEAMNNLQKGLLVSIDIGAKEYILNAYYGLTKAKEKLNDFKKAFEYHQLYSQIKDSLFNEGSSKQIHEMSTKYETEKKEQQINLLNKDKELQSAQLNRQKIVIWSVGGGLFVVILLSFFIFKERKKSEKLLLNILPIETARELKKKGKALPKQYELVSVLFTDFKGFTTIAEKMSVEELVSELDFVFRKFDEIISKYPIEKIKTIGDAYMCAGGLPVANTTNPIDVVMAALDIQKFIEEYKQLCINEGKQYFEIRIGVHSGPVVAGVVGDKKFAYDIWGDTVNTASRMESSGEQGKVNISEHTYELVKNNFNCMYRGKLNAKNKGEINMYFVEKT